MFVWFVSNTNIVNIGEGYLECLEPGVINIFISFMNETLARSQSDQGLFHTLETQT